MAVAALARAKKKKQNYYFLSRIHRLRSCGASGVREKRGGNVRLDIKMRRQWGQMASVSASYYMFLRMARLQKVYHCKVFHMPFSLSLCPTLYVSVHLLLLNLRCFLQRCIYIIFYDANIFSLSLPKSIYKLFLGTCVWLL